MAATLSLIVRNLLSVSKPGKGWSLGSTLYLSVDIEADGPIPGPYSMLSIGAVAVYGPTASNRHLGQNSSLEQRENQKAQLSLFKILPKRTYKSLKTSFSEGVLLNTFL